MWLEAVRYVKPSLFETKLRFGILPEFVRIAGQSAAAAVVCAPMFFEARPRTPLRVFCIAAFEYLARLGGRTLGRQRRVAIAHACDFGSLRDEYYDEQKLDRAEYRSLRRALRRIAPERSTLRYIRQLRDAERSRPIFAEGGDGVVKATIGYRKSVIKLSLAWMESIAGLACERVKAHSLVSLVCLMQLADDLLDWKEDRACGCPSYVTAFLAEQPGAPMAKRLRAQADRLLQRTVHAARRDAGAVPFAVAGVATWTFVVALLKVRCPQ